MFWNELGEIYAVFFLNIDNIARKYSFDQVPLSPFSAMFGASRQSCETCIMLIWAITIWNSWNFKIKFGMAMLCSNSKRNDCSISVINLILEIGFWNVLRPDGIRFWSVPRRQRRCRYRNRSGTATPHLFFVLNFEIKIEFNIWIVFKGRDSWPLWKDISKSVHFVCIPPPVKSLGFAGGLSFMVLLLPLPTKNQNRPCVAICNWLNLILLVIALLTLSIKFH